MALDQQMVLANSHEIHYGSLPEQVIVSDKPQNPLSEEFDKVQNSEVPISLVQAAIKKRQAVYVSEATPTILPKIPAHDVLCRNGVCKFVGRAIDDHEFQSRKQPFSVKVGPLPATCCSQVDKTVKSVDLDHRPL